MAKKELAHWREELRQAAAEEAAAQRSTGGGQHFFSLRGGILQYDGAPMPGNRMVAIVLANALENCYYGRPFVEGEKSAPLCFAFGKKEADMEPHSAVDEHEYFERQNSSCVDCPQNEWGSARTGKGKACSNTVRLELLPAGSFKEVGKGRAKTIEFEGLEEDPEHYESAETAFLKLPVMSVKNWSKFVKEMANEHELPPHAVFVEIYVEPDPKSQFRVEFEFIEEVPDDIIEIVMARHAKAQANIDFPYNPPADDDEEEEEAPKPLKKRQKPRG